MAAQVPNTLQIGAILYNSWGYDQTNVDFFEVVDKPSAHFIVIRKVAAEVVTSHTTSESVVAQPGQYIDDQGKRVKADSRNTVKFEGFNRAYPWDGEPKYRTAFGFGH